MINISIPLYGKPSWDMKIEGKNFLNPKILKEQGDYLKEHPYKIADILHKLQSSGWVLCECYGSIYSLDLYKKNIKTEEEAERELNKLGIKSDKIDIIEFENEEELIEE